MLKGDDCPLASSMQIYLDHSATTPTRPEAIATMQTVLAHEWGNPSSVHHWGERAATVVELARMQVAGAIAAMPDQITFTAGGTEADNLAIFGITRQYRRPRHVIISAVEHSAIAQPAQWLASQGWSLTTLPVNAQGRVNPEDLRAAIRPDTVLISVIYGQSEIGTLQPVEALGAIARQAGIPFHVDAVQALGRVPIDVQRLPVDLLSMSSHKIYGPQGVGALYVRPGIELVPLVMGGGQEGGLRSGTQAVAAIAGFGTAAELAAAELPQEVTRLTALRDRLFERLANLPDLVPTGDRLHRLPHHVSFCLRDRPGCPPPPSGRELVRQLNLAGIAASSGSACNSGKLSPSPTLLQMGYSDAAATAALRLTLGRSTTDADIDWVAIVLRQILQRLITPCAPRSMYPS
jgi:cysteine desulfurase